MSSLTNQPIYQYYGDLLTTTNGGNGLSITLEPVQDGLGQSSPMEISLDAVNFIRTSGDSFQLDGIDLTASATDINSVAKGNPILPGTGGTLLPSGTTAQRYSPPVNGVIRYNTQLNTFEGYVNGSWQPFDAGSVVGPGLSVTGDIAIFSDTSGNVIADSGVSITSVPGPLLGPPPPGPLVTDVQLAGIDILSFQDVGLIFTGSGSTEDVYVCGFHPNTISGKSPNTVFGFSNPSSPDAIVELTQGALLVSRLDQTTINALIDVDGMMVYNSTTDSFNFRQNGAWVNFNTGSVTSILGTANEIIATGSSTVTIAIASNPILPGTGSVTIPTGTTGQRPGSPIIGDLRYNSTTSEFEGYNGAWTPFGSGGGSVTSITAGSNLTGGTITTTGTIALSNTITGLTSINVGNLELIGNQLTSTDTNGNIDLLPNGTGNILLGAAPVTIFPSGVISAFGIDLLAVGGNPALIEFFDANNSNFVALRAPDTVPSNYSLLLPSADGSSGQGITTDGSGSLSFSTLANPNATYIVQTADPTLPNAQDLFTVGGGMAGTGGILKINNVGVVALAVPDVDYATLATLLMIEASCTASAAAASSDATAAGVSAGAAAASAVTAGVEAAIATTAAGTITGATSAKFIIQEPNTNLPNAQSLSTLSAGLIKNTIVGPDGVLAIATPGTDYYSPTNPTTLREYGTNVLFYGNTSGNGSVSGADNTGVGSNVLPLLTSGFFNVGFGVDVLESATTAAGNTCFGTDLALGITTGQSNTFVGLMIGSNLAVNGSNNVAVGDNIFDGGTGGNGNTAIGSGAGSNQGTSNSTFLGLEAQAGVNGLTNCAAIGANSIVNTSNSMVLGDGTVNVGIGTSSPTRTLTVIGGQIQNITETAISYTVLNTDLIVGVTSTAAPRTITLPTAASANKGQIYTVKDESGGALINNITVNVTGGGNIDGAATFVINTNYGSSNFYSNGTQWYSN